MVATWGYTASKRLTLHDVEALPCQKIDDGGLVVKACLAMGAVAMALLTQSSLWQLHD